MKKHAVILAGGEGRRAGGEMPKQFQKLLGIPLLMWAVKAFHDADPDTKITLVMHPGFFDLWDILHSELPDNLKSIDIRLVAGGKDRPHSVANGIMGIEASEDALIAVHDAARPLLNRRIISDGWDAAIKYGAAFPACPVTDSLREMDDNGVARPVERARFIAVQTPQVFRADILKSAYADIKDTAKFTDDASLVENAGYKPSPFPGEPDNIKVTNPSDFIVAEALLEYRIETK